MKKFIFICMFLFIVLISACSDEELSESKESEEKTKEAAQEKQEDLKSNNEKKDKEENEPATSETLNPKYKINQENWLVQPLNESINEKVVLLTIDDAPDEYAVDMAKTLKELEAGAIFFVNGHFIKTPEGKENLKTIHDMGFMIGNHTYSHAFLPDLSKQAQKEEIVKVNQVVKEIIGEQPLFFRAPNGANTTYTKQIAKEQDMILMNWSYGYDWNKEFMSKNAITDIMLHTELLGNGANLLMHDREWTAKALHDIVIGLREQGYEIVDPHLIKTY